MRKKLFLPFFGCLAVVPLASLAEENVADTPSWAFEFKGGRFKPAADQWSTFYGSDETPQLGAAFSYKPLRILDLGIQGEWIHDKGAGLLPFNNSVGGSVTTDLYPLSMFLLLRAVFYENQWIVPYVGAGWTRIYYDQKAEGQGDAQGHADGSHIRAGLQFLLDGLNRSDSTNLNRSFGIDNTYLILEMQTTKANVDSIDTDLGGRAYSIGLLFEY